MHGNLAMSEKQLTVLVLLPKPDWEGLSFRPDIPAGVTAVFGCALADFDPALVAAAEGIVWVPPSKEATLAEVAAAATSAKWLHAFSAGVDYIASFIGASKLAVSNGRSAFSKSLAEYALMAVLHFNKQVPRCQQNRLEKKWDKFTMDVIEGKTIGFVGYGSIAQHTAKLAKAFGMRSVALRRNPEKAKDDPEPELVAATYGLADAATLYQQADFVVCSLPGTAATTNFINAAAFAAMKPTAVFISLGRGAAVDEAALHHALTTGQIAGAALDVYKQEPLPAESPLWGCDNVLMTAHNADLTADYFSLGWKVWLENLAAYRSSATLATPVNTAEGY